MDSMGIISREFSELLSAGERNSILQFQVSRKVSHTYDHIYYRLRGANRRQYRLGNYLPRSQKGSCSRSLVHILVYYLQWLLYATKTKVR